MPLTGMGFNAPLLYNSLAGNMNGLIPWEVVQELNFGSGGLFKYKNNFSQYIGPTTAGTSNGWVLTETAAGAGNTNSVVGLSTGLVLTTDNGANDLENIQRTQLDYAYVAGKQSGFIAKVAPGATLTSLDILFGLALADTSLIASAPADGFIFRKLAAANVFSFLASKTGETTITITAIDQENVAASTYRYYAFIVDAAGAVHVYWGKTLETMVRVGGIAAGSAALTTAALALSFSIRTTTTSSRQFAIGSVAYWREL